MSGLIAALRASLRGQGSLQPGDPAPRFALNDHDGKLQQLDRYRGHWVVLYFYPKDGTPVCTREACTFRDDLLVLRQQDAQVIGVSTDSSTEHRAFAVRYGLNFPLLSDPEGTLSDAYGSYFRLGPIRFSRRRTFLIDPDGRIARIYHRFNVANHSADILRDLRALRRRAAS